MSEKVQTENENFINALLLLGFSTGTAILVLSKLQGNQSLIRLVGSGTNFALSDRQVSTFTKALTSSGIPDKLAAEITTSVQQVELKHPSKDKVQDITNSAFVNSLVAGGLAISIAKIVNMALNQDEKISELIGNKKRPVVFITKRDNKVDDLICLPLEGNVYAIDDPKRVKIPSGTHLNCRCEYWDAVTGENLGQF